MSKRSSLVGRNGKITEFFNHSFRARPLPKVTPPASLNCKVGRVFRVVKDSAGNYDAVPIHQVKAYLES